MENLSATSVKIYTYNSKEPLPLQGSIAVNISHNGHTVSETANVCPGNGGNLLSGKLATQLGLMHMANTTVTMGKDNNFTNKVKAKFPRLFSGIGKLKNYSVKLHINRSIKPVANTHRRIPFHLRDPVENNSVFYSN